MKSQPRLPLAALLVLLPLLGACMTPIHDFGNGYTFAMRHRLDSVPGTELAEAAVEARKYCRGLSIDSIAPVDRPRERLLGGTYFRVWYDVRCSRRQ